MSDLDGASTPPNASFSTPATSKLRSLTRSSSIPGAPDDVVDAFAEIFARMAAGTPSLPQSQTSLPTAPSQLNRSERSAGASQEASPAIESDRDWQHHAAPSPEPESNEVSGDLNRRSSSRDVSPREGAGTDERGDDGASNAPVAVVPASPALTERTAEAPTGTDSSKLAESVSADVVADGSGGKEQGKEQRSAPQTPVRSETPSATSEATSQNADDGTRREESSEMVESDTSTVERSAKESGRETRLASHHATEPSNSDSKGTRPSPDAQNQRQPDQPTESVTGETPSGIESRSTAAQPLRSGTDSVAPATVNPSVTTTVGAASSAHSSSGATTNPTAGRVAHDPTAPIAPTKAASVPQASAKSDNPSDTVSRVRLIQRVSKAFQHLGANGGVVRLRLAPAELGSIQIEMKIHQRKIQARVVAETEAATAALREHLPELRARLESFGMQIEKLDVETGGDSRQQGTPFEERSQQQTRHPQRSHESVERIPDAGTDSSDVSPAVSPTGDPDQGMDVRL